MRRRDDGLRRRTGTGPVTLAGDTAATEVITATATRFTEPDVSLAGSTSEFSECLADLSITKTDDPDPVAVGGPLTYTTRLVNDGPAPATERPRTDTLPVGVIGDVDHAEPRNLFPVRSDRRPACSIDRRSRRHGSYHDRAQPWHDGATDHEHGTVSSDLRDPDQSRQQRLGDDAGRFGRARSSSRSRRCRPGAPRASPSRPATARLLAERRTVEHERGALAAGSYSVGEGRRVGLGCECEL